LASPEEQLVQSNLAKTHDKKTPTPAEAKAYQRAVDARILNQLKSVTPDFFNQLFQIQKKQRYDWQEHYKFPAGVNVDFRNRPNHCSTPTLRSVVRNSILNDDGYHPQLGAFAAFAAVQERQPVACEMLLAT
jgi:hypothetical protein